VVQRAWLPGFVSMEVLRSEEAPEGEDEVLIITRWRDREAFDAWSGARSCVYHPH